MNEQDPRRDLLCKQVPLKSNGEYVFKTVKVAAVAVRTPIGDKRPPYATLERNVQRVAEAISKCDPNTGIVVTQEIAGGYERERLFHRPGVFETEFRLMMEHIAPLSKYCLIIYGLPIRDRFDRPYNGAAYLFNGECIAMTAKQQLAQGTEYEDARYFEPLQPGHLDKIVIDGKTVPFGDIFVSIGGINVQAYICEDLWPLDGPASEAVARGIHIGGWLNTSHEEVGKHESRITVINATSQGFGGAIVGSNALGVQGGHRVFGGGNLISCNGKLVAAEKRFSFRPYVITTAVIDINSIQERRLSTQSLRNGRDSFGHCETREGSLICGQVPSKALDLISVLTELGQELEEREDQERRLVTRSWIWEMITQSALPTTLTLNSGGSDSGLTLLLQRDAFEAAWKELGAEGFRAEFAHLEGIDQVTSVDDFVRKRIYAPYLPGRTSGGKTEAAAKALAEALGFVYFSQSIIDIEAAMNAAVGGCVGIDNMHWDAFLAGDIDSDKPWRVERTLENAPVRSRGSFGGQLANFLGAYYFTTSNLDEVWAKYYTLWGGDPSGSGGAIAGCSKMAILRMFARIAKDLGSQVAAAAKLVLAMPPTAELKPDEMGQTDDGELGKLVQRSVARDALIGQERSALQALLLLADEFIPDDAEAETINQHMAELAFVVCRLSEPAYESQWARFQLPLAPVVDGSRVSPGTEESNRRAWLDTWYIDEVRELLGYLVDNLPPAFELLKNKKGNTWQLKQLFAERAQGQD